MEKIKISSEYNKKEQKNILTKLIPTKQNILIFINLVILLYLIIENKKNKNEIKRITDYLIGKKKYNISFIDKDMIGINYPDINFGQIKYNLIHLDIISSLIDFMTQLEVKLIYIEKEINVTKISSFYTSRKMALNQLKVQYDDYNLTYFHNIISWLVIHKSTQLKGIASDKFLACKYVQLKIGQNLCPQRIKSYDKLDDINFDEILKLGNLVIKISNGGGDAIFIYNNTTKEKLVEIKEMIKHNYEKDYGIQEAEFFHLYAKKE